MDNKFEKREEISSKTETIRSDVLENLIYKGTGEPQDRRFLSTEEGGVFKYFDPRDMTDPLGNHENKFFSLIKIDDKIIGLSELEKNPYQENSFWIKFLSIDPEYQGKGYASKLAEEVFRFAKQKGFSVETSSYTDEGYKKLKDLFNKLANKYSVKFIDKGKM